ncbi:hypothetical protein [Kitasatospora sp. NPDC058397]
MGAKDEPQDKAAQGNQDEEARNGQAEETDDTGEFGADSIGDLAD